jgi:CHAP domain
LDTAPHAGRWMAHRAPRRRARRALCVGVAAGAAVGLTAAFLALTIAATLGWYLAAQAGCETGSDVTMPAGGGVLVAATVYSDSGAGAYGAGLAGHYGFAELGLWSESDGDRSHADRIGIALGLGRALAPYTELEIRAPNGRVVIAEKRDVGMGGPPIDAHARAIDLWTSTRAALGLPADWSGLVRVQAPLGGVLNAEAGPPGPSGGASGHPAATSGCGAGDVPASEVGMRIVQVARTQLGLHEQPLRSNCTPYGPCESWCALFVTWVWRHAGVDIPSLAFSGAVYDWAIRHARVYPPTAHPRPGWAALFGSGPQDTSTSLHVAIVDNLLPGGEITLINGNFADAVMRTGPCSAANAHRSGAGGCEEPGAIYAYAAPE